MRPSSRRTSAGRVLGVVTAVLAAIATVLMAGPAQATFPGNVGLVVFTRGGDLYTATSSGGAITRLTSVGQISNPKWSPDGKTIVYRRGTSIYTRTYPGAVTKTVGTGALSDASWSPDGSRIAYLTTVDTSGCGDQAIVTVPAAGGAQVTAWSANSLYDTCTGYVPTFTFGTYTPDGRALLTSCYTHGEDSGCWIDSVSMDGTNSTTRILTIGCTLPATAPKCTQAEHLSDARTGPAGTAIYFSGKGGYDAPTGTLPGSTASPTSSTLERPYTMSTNGSGLHSVTTAASGYGINRAPTGSTILFVQKSGSTTNILKATSDAATAKATTFITNASQPDWQPAS